MKKQKKKPEMTRKEALAVVHKAFDAGGAHIFSPDASEEAKALSKQIHTAFRILDVALHGERAGYYCSGLCHFCYLRFSNSLFARIKGGYVAKPCCNACIEQLKAEQKLERVEDWEGKEVASC